MPSCLPFFFHPSVHLSILPKRSSEAFQSPLSFPPTPIVVWSSVLCSLHPPLSECLFLLRRALPSSLSEASARADLSGCKVATRGTTEGAILCCYSITAIGGRCFAGHCGPHPQSAHTKVDVVEWRAGVGQRAGWGGCPPICVLSVAAFLCPPLSGKCLPNFSPLGTHQFLHGLYY